MKKKIPRKPNCPPSVFAPAEHYIVRTKGDVMGDEVFVDILAACERQRELDPRVTWIVRKPDGAVLKIRNGSTADLKRLVQRYGGHL